MGPSYRLFLLRPRFYREGENLKGVVGMAKGKRGKAKWQYALHPRTTHFAYAIFYTGALMLALGDPDEVKAHGVEIHEALGRPRECLKRCEVYENIAFL